MRRFADVLRISRIVLLPLYEGLDVGRWDESHVMAQLPYLTAPEVGAAAGFHRDKARRQLAEKLQNLSSTQLLAQDRSTTAVRAMQLKHILSPTVIISDMTVLLCGSSQTHLGTPMPSGGGHIINASQKPR